MNVPHKHAAVLIAMAKGEQVEGLRHASFVRDPETELTRWIAATDGFNPLTAPETEWRVKPQVLNINGIRCVAPYDPGDIVAASTARVTLTVDDGDKRVHVATYFHRSLKDAKGHFFALGEACVVKGEKQ